MSRAYNDLRRAFEALGGDAGRAARPVGIVDLVCLLGKCKKARLPIPENESRWHEYVRAVTVARLVAADYAAKGAQS